MKPNGSRCGSAGCTSSSTRSRRADATRWRWRDSPCAAAPASSSGATRPATRASSSLRRGAIRDLCREYDALFFVNDHVDLALACAADGAHLGQKDLPLSSGTAVAARRFPPRRLIEQRRGGATGGDATAPTTSPSAPSSPPAARSVTRPASLERLREVKAGGEAYRSWRSAASTRRTSIR